VTVLILRIDADARVAEVFDVEDEHLGEAAKQLYYANVTNRFEGESNADALGRLGRVLDSDLEHRAAGPPEPRVFVGTEWWVMTATVEEGEAVVGVHPLMAERFGLAPGLAVATSEADLDKLRVFGREVARESGLAVDIKHYRIDGVESILPPPTITNAIEL
jgi:hypothetical protein